jgi:GNAT superfamily N-acetyltransferase
MSGMSEPAADIRPHGSAGPGPVGDSGSTPAASAVAAASAAWVWTPDNATVVEGDGYTILRLPEYSHYQLEVNAFRPAGPLGSAVDAVIARARSFGLPELWWQVRLEDPARLAAELTSRGAQAKVTLDVLARDLSQGGPALPPPTEDVTVRWATDFQSQRDASAVGISGFGGTMPPDERLAANAVRDRATTEAGEGGLLVAYLNGVPAGAGGVTVVDGVARLWGGAVVPAARGNGVYRALLNARIRYAATHGATMALVKGNVATSGPILRRAGFTAFGQEPRYSVPL